MDVPEGGSIGVNAGAALDAAPLDLTSGVSEEYTGRLNSDSFAEGHQSETAPEFSRVPHDTFADSPADISETQISPPALDPLEELRRLMRTTRKDSQPSERITTQAWSLYQSLNERDSKDARLRNELVDWFASHRSSAADEHCISLFWSMPSEERSRAAYEVVFAAYLARKDVDSALIIQKEAMSNISYGHHISVALFKYALVRQLWLVALQVEHQYTEAFDETQKERQQELFWIHVAEIPDLLSITALLVTHLRRHRENLIYLSNFRSFSSKLCVEAVVHHLHQQESRGNRYDTQAIRDLRLVYRHLGDRDGELGEFYQHSLESLLRLLSKHPIPPLFHLTSMVYKQWRGTVAFAPSEQLLLSLLEHLTLYSGRMEQLSGTRAGETLRFLFQDWHRHHGTVSDRAIQRLISYYSHIGDTEGVYQIIDHLREQNATFAQLKEPLGATIYVHARRMELSKAKLSFERACKLAEENGEDADLRWWNMLLNAHDRVDDLTGALDTFERLVKQTKLSLNARSFHPIMNLLARRGDVEGIQDLMAQFNSLCQDRAPTRFSGSLMTALVNIGEMEKAEELLKVTLGQLKRGETYGSLTGNCNVLLSSCALRKDVEGILRTEQWMKAEGIRMNANSHAALMQGLAAVRRTNDAWSVLRSMIHDHGIPPTAFHYAIIMMGYINERRFNDAITVYDTMRERNIRQSISTRKAYLQARLYKEHFGNADALDRNPADESAPLNDIIAEFSQAISSANGDELTSKQPALGYRRAARELTLAECFEPIIFIHGERRCMEAVQEMYRQYKLMSGTPEEETSIPSHGILSGLMTAYLKHRNYAEVEELWKMAKSQADGFNRIPSIHALTQPAGDASDERQHRSNTRPTNLDPSAAVISLDELLHMKIPKNEDLSASMRLLARRQMLNRPLRYYLHMLVLQSRIPEAVSTIAKLLREGYTLNTSTWNLFISGLCRVPQPMVLLAFVLTERFLIAQFPGWSKKTAFGSSRRALVNKTQFMQHRRLGPDDVFPEYRTMVRLAGALLRLRRIEATSGKITATPFDDERIPGYIGTTQQIEEQAPDTLFAVENLPMADDSLQAAILD